MVQLCLGGAYCTFGGACLDADGCCLDAALEVADQLRSSSATPSSPSAPACLPACLRQALCPALLERFKEKNIVMAKASEESLRTLAQYCFTLVDVAEDVVAALGHNNPKGGCLWCRAAEIRHAVCACAEARVGVPAGKGTVCGKQTLQVVWSHPVRAVSRTPPGMAVVMCQLAQLQPCILSSDG